RSDAWAVSPERVPSAAAVRFRLQPSIPIRASKDRRSGTSRSGASVSSRAERPCRRTQTVAQPSRRAGGTSETPSAACAIASGGPPLREGGGGLEGAALRGGHDGVEPPAEPRGGRGKQVAVDVRDDREPVAA